ncbi:MAG: CvpA family protein [Sphingomonadales bacterium]|jgi:membrane protein required for colicin V production
MAWFDLALIVLLAVSTIFAFFRGFVTEALHLIALGGAVIATVIGYPYLEPYLVNLVGKSIIVTWIGNAVTFIVTLAALRFGANFIGSKVRQSELGFLDRSLGALFGALRGFLIVVFIYILFLRLWQPTNTPEFIQEARLGFFVTDAAEILDPYIDGDSVKTIVDKARNVLPEKPIEKAKRQTEQPTEPPKQEPAYNEEQRDALDELFESEVVDKAIDKSVDKILERMSGEETSDDSSSKN